MSTVHARSAATSVPVEDSAIKRIRLRKGVTVRELAGRLSVTPGAISQMERSEAAGTIGIGTLSRALTALGERLVVTHVGTSDAERPPRSPFERREDRVTYELHRAIAKKLIDDPDRVLALMPVNLARLRGRVLGSLGQRWIDQWEAAAKGPVWELVRLMLGEDENSKELRQNSPFVGVLSQDERLHAIERAAGR